MEQSELIAAVEAESGLEAPAAARAVHATLQTLGERVSSAGARQVARRLPAELRPALERPGDPDGFDVEEFVLRIARREGVEAQVAEIHARGVFAALEHAGAEVELAALVAELPIGFRTVLVTDDAAGAPPGPMAAEAFYERVAERAGLDHDEARRATAAVLEELGSRITRGEIEDLEAELAPELRPPLARGDQESHGAARRIGLRDFEREVAEREGVTPQEAHDHIRAVFATLREAVSPKEFSDMTAQLPDEFRAVLARP
jgi:uncharacterized protein (DUF2267 family)